MDECSSHSSGTLRACEFLEMPPNDRRLQGHTRLRFVLVFPLFSTYKHEAQASVCWTDCTEHDAEGRNLSVMLTAHRVCLLLTPPPHPKNGAIPPHFPGSAGSQFPKEFDGRKQVLWVRQGRPK